jgi:hypothetical protein
MLYLWSGLAMSRFCTLSHTHVHMHTHLWSGLALSSFLRRCTHTHTKCTCTTFTDLLNNFDSHLWSGLAMSSFLRRCFSHAVHASANKQPASFSKTCSSAPRDSSCIPLSPLLPPLLRPPTPTTPFLQQ